MPKVYEACGLLGAELQSNSIPTCQDLDNYIFNPRMPACHGNSAPSPETASFSVFYVLLTVRVFNTAIPFICAHSTIGKSVPHYQQQINTTTFETSTNQKGRKLV